MQITNALPINQLLVLVELEINPILIFGN